MAHPLGLMILLLLVASTPGNAQVLYTFTSGPPPIGDGVEYPRTLNPARLTPEGFVAPDFFDTGTGMVFQSTHGNPAFFDANNLLTRPAERITNEAFWMDPKIGVFDAGKGEFEEAGFGFQFVPRNGEDFGFDLAVASFSEAPPESLFFFIQNTANDFGNFEMDLTLGGTGAIQPVETGTFQTLGSPFDGLEARYRIAHSDMEALLGSSAPLLIFSISLFPIATLGGTTQIAMDNFVLAGASVLPNEEQREPVRFQSELLPPGELQYFVLDPTNSSETGIEIDIGALPEGSLIELAARTSAPPGSPAPEAEVSATVTTLEGNIDLVREAFDVGVSAPSDTPDTTVPPFVTWLAEVEVTVEPTATSTLHAVGARSMTYGDATFGVPLPDEETLISAYENTHVLQASHGNLREAVGEASKLSPQVAALLSRMGEGGRHARGADDDFTLYVGYTLQDYLAEKRQFGLEPVLGDSGSALTPVTDDEGQVVDFFIDTWRIADTPGTYIPTLLLPEPGGVGMLAIGGLVLGAAARRRR